ncbi:MAG: FKBP-type peptidyl-prolyl cis-trans isomerase [Bacteroidaceae bacterium]|nr:FKBP-type peptidyl-prolyl cis-trans isomerase [Bacteroidaceae bacterium]
MKKSFILMAVAIVAVLASCQTAPKANISDKVDSLSYTMGIAQTQGLKEYLVNRMGVDTTYMDSFIKGLLEGVKSGDNAKQTAYMSGVQIGQQVANQIIPGVSREAFGNDSTKVLDKDNFLAGFIAGTTGKDLKMEPAEAQATAQRLMEEFHKESLLVEFGDNKAAGEAFMDSIAKVPGVIKTESGLCYRIITEGKGDVPAKTDKVKVNYRGTLIDGTEFDSSYKRNDPTTFRANQVITGWTEALTMMPVGSKWELFIPQDLAYGDRNQGQIKPFSTLVFDVELLSIEK